MGGNGTGVGNARDRIHRVNELWQMIINNSGEPKEQIIAQFGYKYGLARRTTLDYLKVLICNDKVFEKDKNLISN